MPLNGDKDIGKLTMTSLNDNRYVIFIQKIIREFCINNPKDHVSPHPL